VAGDGYSALQVTWGQQKPHRITQPENGHFEKAGVTPGTKLVELRLDDVSEFAVGQELSVDLLEAGDLVDVTAVSRGKGFAGAMKRHGFKGQRASHGAHKVHRKPGAVGQCATPSRVFRGKKMPGRMGGTKVTTLNLTVVEADAERDLLLVRGAVPGAKGATVVIRNATKADEPSPEERAAKKEKAAAEKAAQAEAAEAAAAEAAEDTAAEAAEDTGSEDAGAEDAGAEDKGESWWQLE